jgi:hypothetical protein
MLKRFITLPLAGASVQIIGSNYRVKEVFYVSTEE